MELIGLEWILNWFGVLVDFRFSLIGVDLHNSGVPWLTENILPPKSNEQMTLLQRPVEWTRVGFDWLVLVQSSFHFHCSFWSNTISQPRLHQFQIIFQIDLQNFTSRFKIELKSFQIVLSIINRTDSVRFAYDRIGSVWWISGWVFSVWVEMKKRSDRSGRKNDRSEMGDLRENRIEIWDLCCGVLKL